MKTYNLDTKWDDVPFLAIDTETTGFRSSDRVVEIGIALFEGDKVVDTYCVMVNPRVEMNKEAAEITGIDTEDYADAPLFVDVLEDVLRWLSLYEYPWVAHNMSFDTRMLSYDIPRDRWPTGIPTFCTMKAAKDRGMSRKALSFVASALDVPQTTAHRALADAIVCGHIARRFTKHCTIGALNHGMSEAWI